MLKSLIYSYSVYLCLSKFVLGTGVAALIPLMENMPGGAAIKPGDVLVGMNNKTIRVEHTANEGRVVTADALVHAHHYNPCLTMNIATMTGECCQPCSPH